MSSTTPHYQPHVDGLRALAVASVIVFHALPEALPGGFIGVDIFFVISGFLITGIILREIESGTFSIVRFLERRARRLLPALALVLAATTIGAWILLLPEDLISYGRSLTATALFSSNIHFWNHSGYFDGAAQSKPLLHTWSLAVEEQFYFVWPLLILACAWLIRRLHRPAAFRPVLLALTLVGSVASLAFAEDVFQTAPTTAFFLTPFRIWEFGIGAALAIIGLPKLGQLPAPVRSGIAMAGVAGILFAILSFSHESAVPGLDALIPTLGAAAVIACGGTGPVGRVLSSAPMVAVGLVSYAAYLWHWPIIALIHDHLGRGVQGAEILAIIALVSVLSVLTTHFVERPFRAAQWGIPIRRIAVAAGVLAAVAGVGRAMWLDNGWISRLTPAAKAIYQASASRNPFRSRCDGYQNAQSDHRFCNFGAAKPDEAAFDLVVLGDSNADQWVPMLAEYTQSRGWSGRQVTNSTCAPVLGVDRRHVADALNQQCARYQDAILEFLQRNPNLREVVLAGVWGSFLDEQIEANHVQFDARTLAFADRFGVRGTFSWHMAATIAVIRRTGADVLLIAPLVQLPGFTPNCVVKAVSGDRSTVECGISRMAADRYVGAPTAVLEQLASQIEGVRLVRPIDALCSKTDCSPTLDNVLLYRDFGHLNAMGAVALGRKLGLLPAPSDRLIGANPETGTARIEASANP